MKKEEVTTQAELVDDELLAEEEIKIFKVSITLTDFDEIEAETEEDAERIALEGFLQDCSSPRWVKSNVEIEIVEE